MGAALIHSRRYRRLPCRMRLPSTRNLHRHDLCGPPHHRWVDRSPEQRRAALPGGDGVAREARRPHIPLPAHDHGWHLRGGPCGQPSCLQGERLEAGHIAADGPRRSHPGLHAFLAALPALAGAAGPTAGGAGDVAAHPHREGGGAGDDGDSGGVRGLQEAGGAALVRGLHRPRGEAGGLRVRAAVAAAARGHERFHVLWATHLPDFRPAGESLPDH
mmetsp:Transcript_61459/g.170418  ORF Transcript_61459/g.170418 Transcript_61459/m.170418 type:complete len:217 (-) Transcript_61459:617-1267(-)